MSGPAPKPTSLRARHGDPDKKVKPPKKPGTAPPVVDESVASSFDVPPSEIQDDKIAMNEWSRVVPALRRRKSILRLDRSALIAYCKTYSAWCAAEARIKLRGATAMTRTGYMMASPDVSISQNAVSAMMKFWIHFGMTPAARARIRAEQPKLNDEPSEDLIVDKEDELFEGLFLAKGSRS